MEIKTFLATQVDAITRRGQTFDSVRAEMERAEAPPECTAYILERLQEVLGRHSAVITLNGGESASEAANKVEQLFRPIIDELMLELMKSLIVNWYSGLDSDGDKLPVG